MQKYNSFELSVVFSKEIWVFWISGYLGIAYYFNLAITNSDNEEPKESLIIEYNLLSNTCCVFSRISFGCCGRFTAAELLSFSLSVMLVLIWVLTGHWLLMDGK